ncbi:MAG TPA: DUF459 domain-containing protein [Aestuariivirgaceae bacterium]|nr:DUF459 domain-containing protein [Aestuariivirgaceae bacterium]
MRRALQVLALLAAALCWAGLSGGTSFAQQLIVPSAEGPAPPSNGYSVFIIGDALAGGLWAGTTRVGSRFPDFAINGRFKEESGLARPEIYDWANAVPKILERHLVDIAIVFIGINDAQDIRSDSGRLAFASTQWAAAYQARIDEIVAVFLEKGVAVYWVGLPPMRAPQHEEAVSAIAALQRARVLAGGAKYIDIRPPFAGPEGSYAQSGIGIDGRETRLRSLDGIKFIKAGNDKLAMLVLEAISADLGLAPPGAVLAEAGTGAASAEVSHLPLFGTELADGTMVTIGISDLADELAVQGQAQGARLDLDQAADTPAAPDSAAAALFDNGRWPTPKPGRIDDFSWPRTQ